MADKPRKRIKTFDYNDFRNAGGSEEDALQFYRENPDFGVVNLDIDGFLNAGGSPTEALSQLSTGKPAPAPDKIGSSFKALTKGLLSNFGGAPVDLATSALEASTAQPRYKEGDVVRRVTHGGKGLPSDVRESLFVEPEKGSYKDLERSVAEKIEYKRPPGGAFGGSQSIARGLQNSAAIFGLPKDSFIYEKVEDLHPSDRPFAYAMESIGESLPFGGLPFALAKGGVKGGKLLGPIINAAKTTPKTLAATEGLAIGGGAYGAGISEALWPGEFGPRVAMQVGGGLLNPLALATRAGVGAVGQVRNAVGGVLSEASQKRQAAEAVQKYVMANGFTPGGMSDLVDVAVNPAFRSQTVAQATGHPALIALEQKIASRSPSMQQKILSADKLTRDQMGRQIDDMERSGRPADLQAAAELRKTQFDEVIQARYDQALQTISEAEARAGLAGADIRVDASVSSRKALKSALKDVRDTEDVYWLAVDKSEDVGLSGTSAAYKKVMDELIEGDNVDGIVGIYIRNKMSPPTPSKILDAKGKPIPGTPKTQNLGEAQKIRSKALKNARAARSGTAGDYTDARLWDIIGQGAFADMQKATGAGASEALSFSRSLTNTFRKTFAANALSRTATGADSISPELMLSKAFGGGGDPADLNFRDLRDAAAMGADTRLETMLTEQTNFLRRMAADTMDGGNVNAAKLNNFIKNNEAMLNRFPKLKGDLGNAASARVLFDEAETAVKQASNSFKSEGAFARLIGSEAGEDVHKAVGKILNGADPSADYANVARMAAQSGIGATDGLRVSTIGSARMAATTNAGQAGAVVDYAKFKANLFTPRIKGGKSPVDMMLKSKVIGEDDARRLRSLLDTGIRQADAMRPGGAIVDVLGETPDFIDTATRLLGSGVATSMPISKNLGSSLIAAKAGSELARKLLSKIPANKIGSIIEEAMINPELFKALLKTPTSVKEEVVLLGRINAYLFGAGISTTAGLQEDNP